MDCFLNSVISGTVSINDAVEWKLPDASSCDSTADHNVDRAKFVIYFLNYLREQTAHLTSNGCSIASTTPCKATLRGKTRKENVYKPSNTSERAKVQNNPTGSRNSSTAKYGGGKKQPTPSSDRSRSDYGETPRSHRALFSPLSQTCQGDASPSPVISPIDRRFVNTSKEVPIEQFAQISQAKYNKRFSSKPAKNVADVDSESNRQSPSFIIGSQNDFPDLKRPIKTESSQSSRRVATTLLKSPLIENNTSTPEAKAAAPTKLSLKSDVATPTTINSSRSSEKFKENNRSSEKLSSNRQNRSFNMNDSLDISGSDRGSNSSLQWKAFETGGSFDMSNNDMMDSIDENDRELGAGTPVTSSSVVQIKAELCRVTNIAKIDILVRLYAAMISASLVPSLATELYFLAQLVTATDDRVDGNTLPIAPDDSSKVLNSLHNAVHFSVSVFTTLDWLLLLLDKSSLKLLIDNVRVSEFSPSLHGRCSALYAQHLTRQQSVMFMSSPLGGVSFQEDTDNSRNFPNQRSFHLFKAQRDSFYELLRNWSQYHLSPNWSMANSNAECIRVLFSVQLDIANYIHFVRLFVAQLLQMCRGDSVLRKDGEDEDAMWLLSQLKINNPDKYKRLEKRFTVPLSLGGPCPPSSFPGYQEFFHEFIVVTNSAAFHQHLLSGLKMQLNELNGTEFGISDAEDSETLAEEQAKLMSCLCDVRLLAKFAGVVSFLPYQSHDKLPEDISAPYLQLRQQTPPAIDVRAVLAEAAGAGRLCVSVPWLVEYLAMMDPMASQLTYYQAVFKQLIDIQRSFYARLSVDGSTYASAVIVITLGWLFQQNIFPDGSYFDEVVKPACHCIARIEGSLDCSEFIDQKMLFLCCPYLSEVRHLLSNFACGASGGSGPGSIRKITPVLAVSESAAVLAERQTQHELEENFFHNHPSSLKRMVDFVGDRAASRFIKSFCQTSLKRTIDVHRQRFTATVAASSVRDSDTTDLDSPSKLQKSGDDQLAQVLRQCWQLLEKDAERYCCQTCDSAMTLLLAEDTKPQVRQVAAQIAVRIAVQKTRNWATLHLTKGFIKKELAQKKSILPVTNASAATQENTPTAITAALSQLVSTPLHTDTSSSTLTESTVPPQVPGEDVRSVQDTSVSSMIVNLDNNVCDAAMVGLQNSPSLLLCLLKNLQTKLTFGDIVTEDEVIHALRSSHHTISCQQWQLIANYDKMLTRAVLDLVCFIANHSSGNQLWTESVQRHVVRFVDRVRAAGVLSIHSSPSGLASLPTDKYIRILQNCKVAGSDAVDKLIHYLSSK